VQVCNEIYLVYTLIFDQVAIGLIMDTAHLDMGCTALLFMLTSSVTLSVR